ncbi:hypothetical protein ACSBR1_041208 [Camellia fascicularis]
MESFYSLLQLARSHMKSPTSACDRPKPIFSLTFLRTIDSSNYSLYGEIPLEIDFRVIDLSNNNLGGHIPTEVGSLSNLFHLNLAMNHFMGTIPLSIANLSSLRVLSLMRNNLEGNIPIQLGQLSKSEFLQLSANNFFGLLPQEVGLKNLGKLFISENKLFGEIPPALGSCEVLELLSIKGNLFEGTIPTSFKQLKGLQILDVSRNNLSRQIPRFLAELPFLQNLNLSFNMFDGEVLDGGVFRNISAFSIVENNRLCGGIKALQLPTCPTTVLQERKRTFTPTVIALVVIFTVSLLLACFLAILYRTRRQQSCQASPLQNHHLQLSYGELLQATNGFSPDNLIGDGGYGSVYKGILNFGEQIIAMKIITSCLGIDFKGNDFKALVFEFMENGSLERWLRPSLSKQQEPKNLNFVQRLNIAIDMASALNYLHHHCEMAFIHCDLKPSNILLDGDLCAHVSDFGLAKIFLAITSLSYHQQSSSIGIRGIVGYVAPVYLLNV